MAEMTVQNGKHYSTLCEIILPLLQGFYNNIKALHEI